MYFIQECAWLSVCFCDRGGEKDRRGESSVLSLLHPGIFELALTAEAQLFPRQSEIKPLTRTKYSPHYSTKNDQKKNKSTVWRGCVDAALFLEWICPGAETFPPCLEHFAQRRKVSDEPSTQQRSKNLLCSLSSSSFDCYCRFKKKHFNSLKLHIDYIESGTKVFLKSEHGTTMPARGVESRDPMSSGKNETSFHSTPLFVVFWASEWCREGKKNLRGIKRDMFVFPARKRVCALLCFACMCVRRHKHSLSDESGTLFRLLCYCRGSVSSIKN